MAGQYEILNCPFCEKGQISCLYFPSVSSVKIRRTATFGTKKDRTKSADIWIIKSGCSSCGKSIEDVEKELRRLDII